MKHNHNDDSSHSKADHSSQDTTQDVITIQISLRSLVRSIGWFILSLLCLSTIGQLSKYLWFPGRLVRVVRLFWIDEEGNIPTFYSAIALLLCSVLLAIIAIVKRRHGDRWTKHWQVLAGIFLYLALDEAASFHELATDPLRALLQADGILFFTWIIPAAMLVLVFVLSYLQFLKKLPSKTCRLFMLAGGTYLAGAIGSEMVGAWFASLNQQSTFGYIAATTAEEGLEMLGVLIFIHALLAYLTTYGRAIAVQLRNK